MFTINNDNDDGNVKNKNLYNNPLKYHLVHLKDEEMEAP